MERWKKKNWLRNENTEMVFGISGWQQKICVVWQRKLHGALVFSCEERAFDILNSAFEENMATSSVYVCCVCFILQIGNGLSPFWLKSKKKEEKHKNYMLYDKIYDRFYILRLSRRDAKVESLL